MALVDLVRAGGYSIEYPQFSSMAKLKAFPHSEDGQLVRLLSWHEGVGLGGGLFKVSTSSTAAGNDGTVVVASNGVRLLRVVNGPIWADMFGALPNSDIDSMPAVAAAYAYAASVNTDLYIGVAAYKFKGSTPINIDPSRAGIIGYQGKVRIDCSEFTGSVVFSINSSYSYTPAAYYNNLSPALRGLYVFGAKTSGVDGLLVGRETVGSDKSYNGQTEVRECTFDKFDRNIRMGHNSWRVVFYKVNSLNALNPNGILYVPAGLDDSGEILSFYHCQFFDGAGSNIRLSCSSYIMVFNTCSFLNITFFVDSASSATVTCNGCNFENPGSTSTRRYVDISAGHTNVFNIIGGSIVTNSNPGQTQALLYVSTDNLLNLVGVTVPYGRHYQQEQELGYHAFIGGGGTVTTSGVMLQLRNGAGTCPLHSSLSTFSNWDFGYGNLNAWTVDKGTGTSSVVEYLANAGPKGTGGAMRVAPVSVGTNVSQVQAVTNPGMFSMSCMVNIATTSGNAGQVSIGFLDAAGNSLPGGVAANLGTTTTTGWKVIGKNTLRGKVPIGAKQIRVNIQTVAGADVKYAYLLCNVVK